MIWLTRPQADSEALAAQLAKHGIQTLIAPLLTIEQISSPLRGEVGRGPSEAQPEPNNGPSLTLPLQGRELPNAILLTSRHATHALPAEWAHLPVYCVGAATAQAARDRGYTHIIVGEGDVIALLPQIVENLRDKTLLYLSGEDISIDVEALLSAQQVNVQRLIAYRAEAVTTLSPSVHEALKNQNLTGIALFSARTARIACDLLQQANLTNAAANLDAYCLSLAVAQAAGALPWKRLHVAHLPTAQALEQAILATH